MEAITIAGLLALAYAGWELRQERARRAKARRIQELTSEGIIKALTK